MDRKLLAVIALMLLMIGSIGFYFSFFKEVGGTFAQESDLMRFQNERGFEFLGKFNVIFPATVTEIETARDAISFQIKNGSRHNYDNYGGYDLKVVRLDNGGTGETVFVFRSKEKY